MAVEEAPRSGLTLVIDGGDAPRDDVDEMLETFAAENGMSVVHAPIEACQGCHLIGECACAIMAAHEEGCRYRKAATWPHRVLVRQARSGRMRRVRPCTCAKKESKQSKEPTT